MVNHQEEIKRNMNTIIPQYLNSYNKFATNQQKAENLEFDYSFYITFQEFAIGIFFEILNSPSLKSEILQYNSADVIELIEFHCNGLTNVVLENIK